MSSNFLVRQFFVAAAMLLTQLVPSLKAAGPSIPTMVKQGATLEDAFKSDPATKTLIVDTIKKVTKINVGDDHEAAVQTARKTKLSELYGADGKLKSGQLVQLVLTNKIQQELEHETPLARAQYVIQYNGDDQTPWEQFRQTDGTIKIPVSFEGATIKHSDIQTPMKPTAEQKQALLTMLKLYGHGTCFRADVIPVRKGDGIIYYVADLSRLKTDVQSSNEITDGVAVGALNPAGFKRVDIVTDSKFIKPGYNFYLDVDAHEVGHALGLKHPFEPMNGVTLLGNINSGGIHLGAEVDKNMSVVAYNTPKQPYTDVRPRLADYLELRNEGGTCTAEPALAHDVTYSLRQGSQQNIAEAGGDPSIVWVGRVPSENYGQTIVAGEGHNTLDLSSVSVNSKETLVGLQVETPLDLAKLPVENIALKLYKLPDIADANVDPMNASQPLSTIQLSVFEAYGQIHDAHVMTGTVKAAEGNGKIKLDVKGTLDISRPGNQTAIGGYATDFRVSDVGNGHKTLVIHGFKNYPPIVEQKYFDRVYDFGDPANNTIQAPEGTTRVTYNVIHVDKQPPVYQLAFYGAQKLKTVNIYGAEGSEGIVPTRLILKTLNGKTLKPVKTGDTTPLNPLPAFTAPPPALPPANGTPGQPAQQNAGTCTVTWPVQRITECSGSSFKATLRGRSDIEIVDREARTRFTLANDLWTINRDLRSGGKEIFAQTASTTGVLTVAGRSGVKTTPDATVPVGMKQAVSEALAAADAVEKDSNGKKIGWTLVNKAKLQELAR